MSGEYGTKLAVRCTHPPGVSHSPVPAALVPSAIALPVSSSLMAAREKGSKRERNADATSMPSRLAIHETETRGEDQLIRGDSRAHVVAG